MMPNLRLQYKGHTLRFRFPVHKVEAICSYDAPVVISHAKAEDESFTRSPYWLQCPHLVSNIHKMESQGWIHVLQDWIDGPYKKSWMEFTDRVPSLLQQTLPEDYFSRLQTEGRASIGGVLDSSRIKCLHAHYSFYLVHNEGFVGSFVDGLLKWRKSRVEKNDSIFCSPENLECELGRVS